MKHIGLILVFLVIFSVGSGFCQDSNALFLREIRESVRSELQEFFRQREQGSVEGSLILVTGEFVKFVDSAGFDPSYLDFYLSSPLKLIAKPESSFRANNGILVFDEGYKTDIINIPATEKGKWLHYGMDSSGRDFFEISFFDSIRLTFARNLENDCYILEKSIGFPYYHDGDLPFLAILYHRIGDYKAEDIQHQERRIEAPNHSAQRILSTNRNVLMENGQLRANAIVSYISSRNPAVSRQDIESIVSTYIREAEFEQINHDIAIAQMCYATNFLRSQQPLVTHNYAGLKDSRFNDRATGIRAHIQHLKGYATSEMPKNGIVDPRFNLLVNSGVQGTVTTLESLYLTWAPQSNEYGDSITRILEGMSQF